MGDTNWAKIRAEYISKGTPYRKLCEKYDVNERTLCRRAKKEEWQRLRTENVSKLNEKCQQRAEKVIIQNAARDADRMFAATDKLMRKAEQLLELEDPLSPRDLRSLSSTLLDVRTLLGIRDETDREEQKVRIEKMRAEIAAMNDEKQTENKIEVVWIDNPWDKEDGGQDNGSDSE